MSKDSDKALTPPKAAPRARAARKRKPKRERVHGGTVEQRIAHIVGLMREMTFRTGKTGPQLAKKWGLHPDTVAEYAAEASRVVRASAIGDREGIGATIGAALYKAIHAATAAKDWRAVERIADTWAKISGVSAATKLEHSGANGAPIVFDLTGFSSDQIRAALAEDDARDAGAASGADASGAGETGSGDSEPA